MSRDFEIASSTNLQIAPSPRLPPNSQPHQQIWWAVCLGRDDSSNPGIDLPVAIGAAAKEEQEGRKCSMATIGTFTVSEDGYAGSIRTLALNVKAKIARVENPSEKGPDFRIYAGNVEFGAAWQKTSAEGRDYLSVKLDDPSFSAPIYATLSEVETTDSFHLIWSRSNRD